MATIALAGKTLDVPEGMSIESAMVSHGHHPDAFLYLIDGRPVPMDTEPPGDAEIRAVRVASGG